MSHVDEVLRSQDTLIDQLRSQLCELEQWAAHKPYCAVTGANGRVQDTRIQWLKGHETVCDCGLTKVLIDSVKLRQVVV